MTFDLIGNALGNIREGRFRALAITAADARRSYPTFRPWARRVSEVQAGAWFAFFAPTGTPAAAIAWLNKQANEIFSTKMPRPLLTREWSAARSPELLREHVEADTRRWGEVIRKAGIKLP